MVSLEIPSNMGFPYFETYAAITAIGKGRDGAGRGFSLPQRLHLVHHGPQRGWKLSMIQLPTAVVARAGRLIFMAIRTLALTVFLLLIGIVFGVVCLGPLLLDTSTCRFLSSTEF